MMHTGAPSVLAQAVHSANAASKSKSCAEDKETKPTVKKNSVLTLNILSVFYTKLSKSLRSKRQTLHRHQERHRSRHGANENLLFARRHSSRTCQGGQCQAHRKYQQLPHFHPQVEAQ